MDVFQRSTSVCEFCLRVLLRNAALCSRSAEGLAAAAAVCVRASARAARKLPAVAAEYRQISRAHARRAYGGRETVTGGRRRTGASRAAASCVPIGLSNADRDGRRRYNNTARDRSCSDATPATRDPTRRPLHHHRHHHRNSSTDVHVNGFIIL